MKTHKTYTIRCSDCDQKYTLVLYYTREAPHCCGVCASNEVEVTEVEFV